MYKKLIIVLFTCLTLVSCVKYSTSENVVIIIEEEKVVKLTNSNNESESAVSVTVPSDDILRKVVGSIGDTKIVLIKREEAADILSTSDDYTIKLSKFDYASKFKSTEVIDLSQMKESYLDAVVDFDENHIKALEKIVTQVNELLKDKSINLPDEITIILTNGNVEGGAAYTRGSSIIFPSNNVSSKMVELFTHELFHVYSRYNMDKREAMYNLIGYTKCDELIMPDSLKDLTIANPDAPDNNYYITVDYNNEKVSFIPIIYSEVPYDLETNQSFFRYLNDDMLGVTVDGNIPRPILIDGKPLLVKKENITNFYEQIGENTHYTYHPEETIADNFALLVMNSKVKDQWVLDGLAEIIFE